MAYNPKRHHRKSIRLKEWDYSNPGAYFLTLCVKDRRCLFGEIENGINILNDAGRMIKKWYLELAHKFPNIRIDEYVVMPNHFHSIIIITPPQNTIPATVAPVGADLRVCPSPCNAAPHIYENTTPNKNSHAIDFSKESVTIYGIAGDQRGEKTGEHVGSPQPDGKTGEHIGSPQRENDTGSTEQISQRQDGVSTKRQPIQSQFKPDSISSIMQWFKTMTTNEYIRNVKSNGWTPFSGKLWQRDFYDSISRDDEALFKIRRYIKNNPANWNSDEEFVSHNSPRHVEMLNPQKA